MEETENKQHNEQVHQQISIKLFKNVAEFA